LKQPLTRSSSDVAINHSNFNISSSHSSKSPSTTSPSSTFSSPFSRGNLVKNDKTSSSPLIEKGNILNRSSVRLSFEELFMKNDENENFVETDKITKEFKSSSQLFKLSRNKSLSIFNSSRHNTPDQIDTSPSFTNSGLKNSSDKQEAFHSVFDCSPSSVSISSVSSCSTVGSSDSEGTLASVDFNVSSSVSSSPISSIEQSPLYYSAEEENIVVCVKCSFPFKTVLVNSKRSLYNVVTSLSYYKKELNKNSEEDENKLEVLRKTLNRQDSSFDIKFSPKNFPIIFEDEVNLSLSFCFLFVLFI
jgi:hypothetical protein